MTLTVDGKQFVIAQATPTHLYPRTPVEIRTGTGELSISIDEAVTRQTVRLLNSIPLSSPSGHTNALFSRSQCLCDSF